MMFRSNRIITALVVVSLISIGTAHAFGTGDDRGSVGFRGMLLLTGARSAGLGGAGGALQQDVSILALNPASVASLEQPTATLIATDYVLDILPVRGAMSYPTTHGVWSAMISGISYGDFDRTDALAADDGAFDAEDFAIHGGYARTLPAGITVGATVGYVRSTIDAYSASAIVFNAGAQILVENGATGLGLSATNMGTALGSFLGGDVGLKDEVPTEIRIGAFHRPQHFPAPLLLVADITIPRDDEATLSIGAEVRPIDMLALRAGYESLVRYVSSTEEGVKNGLQFDDRHTSSFGEPGLRFGMSLDWRQYGLDYAYAPIGPFGSLHHVAARITW
jgi:hypothetical protein